MSEYSQGKRQSEEAAKSINTSDELVKRGYDPLHAIYVSTQNLLSFFSENITALPELKPYYRIVEKAEDVGSKIGI